MKKSPDVRKQFGQVGIAAAFCLVATLSFAQEAEIKEAERLTDHDKRKQAVEVLKKATAAYPLATQLNYLLGRAELFAGDKAGAKSTFDKGTSNPKEPLNFVGQAHLLYLEKKGAQGKPLLDKALSMGKKNVANLQAIAEAYMTDKASVKEALPLLQKAKEIKENDFKTTMLLGDYYFLENNGGSSASAYEDAATYNSASGAPWYKLGLLYYRSKNLSVAEENMKKAIATDPEFALAHKDLARLYYLKNDGKNAVKHQELFLNLTDSPEDDDQFKLAFYYFSAKDYVKANVEFKKLSEKPNVTPMTLRFFTRSLTEAGQYPEAEKIFSRFMDTKADSIKASDYLIKANLQKLQKNDSLWAMSVEKAVSMDPTLQRPLEDLVAYYFKARKFGPCAIACGKLNKVKKQPDANVYFMQGKALVATKQYPSADTAFAKVIELKPAYVQGYLWAAKSKNAQDGKLDEKDSKVEWLGKPGYEKVIELGELDRENNKKELTEAYQYMVSYYFTKQDIPKGKEGLKKILEINPDDKDAKDLLKSLDQPAPQQKPKKKVG